MFAVIHVMNMDGVLGYGAAILSVGFSGLFFCLMVAAVGTSVGPRRVVMDQTIKDVMQRGVVTCRVDANAAEIAAIMLDNDVSALVVIDESLNACGVVSKTDLIGSFGKDLSGIEAEDLMSPKIRTVSLDTPVHEAVQLMLQHRIHQLIIITQARAHRRPVAIFTSGDALALMAGKTGPKSEAQIRCSECLRKLISIDGCETTDNGNQ